MQKEKILLVEDNKLQRSLLAFLLLEKKYEVIQASNGEEALKLISEKKPDLIISDLEMEKIDGLELCSRIKAHKEHQLIPFLMLSAHETLEEKLKGLAVGADDYIPKSSDKTELLARVHTQLRSRKRHLELQQSYNMADGAVEENSLEQRLYKELLLVRSGLVPDIPQIAGYDVRHLIIPYAQLGKDYCDFIVTPQRYWFIVGHTEGKSLASSMVVAFVKGIIHGILALEPGIPLTDLYILLNRIFYRNIREQLAIHDYMTLLLLTLDKDNQFTYLQSHEHLLFYTASKKSCASLPCNAGWLGLTPEIDKNTLYPQNFSMETGDMALFCTQGLAHAKDNEGNALGRRWREMIPEMDTPTKLVTAVGEFLQRDYTLQDDLTFAALQRSGN